MAGFAFAASAQTTEQESNNEKTNTEQLAQKNHKCTDACTKEGKCMNAPEKKDKKCKAKCQKKKCDKMEGKEHVCTSSCTEGNHVYMHGEKSHVCGDECKQMKK